MAYHYSRTHRTQRPFAGMNKIRRRRRQPEAVGDVGRAEVVHLVVKYYTGGLRAYHRAEPVK